MNGDGKRKKAEEEDYVVASCHLFLWVKYKEQWTLHGFYTVAQEDENSAQIPQKTIPFCRVSEGESGIHF